MSETAEQRYLSVPYHYYPDYVLKWNERSDLTDIEIRSKFEIREYGIHERAILKALYRYQFLNKHNLEVAIGQDIGKRAAKRDYRKNIDVLLRAGVIKRFEYGPENEDAKLYFYALTHQGYGYMEKFQKKEPRTHKAAKSEYSSSPGEVERMLEHLALNQWHLSVKEAHATDILREAYYQRTRFTFLKAYFRSMVMLQYRNRKLCVVATVYPKSKETLGPFLRELLHIEHVCADTRQQDNMLLVVVCESLKQIEQAYLQIAKVEALDHLTPLFATEIIKDGIEDLDCLYSCYFDGEDKKLHLEHFAIVDLKGNDELL